MLFSSRSPVLASQRPLTVLVRSSSHALYCDHWFSGVAPTRYIHNIQTALQRNRHDENEPANSWATRTLNIGVECISSLQHRHKSASRCHVQMSSTRTVVMLSISCCSYDDAHRTTMLTDRGTLDQPSCYSPFIRVWDGEVSAGWSHSATDHYTPHLLAAAAAAAADTVVSGQRRRPETS